MELSVDTITRTLANADIPALAGRLVMVVGIPRTRLEGNKAAAVSDATAQSAVPQSSLRVASDALLPKAIAVDNRHAASPIATIATRASTTLAHIT
jgi:hypothetical protein